MFLIESIDFYLPNLIKETIVNELIVNNRKIIYFNKRIIRILNILKI